MVSEPLILPDSSVWIEFLAGRGGREADLLRSVLEEQISVVLIGDLILFEVLRGTRTAAQRRQVEAVFGPLTQIALCDPDAARRAAERYRTLRSAGITIRRSIDVLIASWCLDQDVTLLHRDRDFAPFSERFGLRTL